MTVITMKPPVPQKCGSCDHVFAGAVCPLCKEERPAYTAVKAMSQAPRCHYDRRKPCLTDCNGRGVCLPAA